MIAPKTDISDITAGSPTTTTSSTTSSTSASALSLVPSALTPTTSGDGAQGTSDIGKHSSNVAAIVGGTVGGILGVLGIGVVAFYMLLRHRKRRSRSQDHGASWGSLSQGQSSAMSDKSASAGMLYVSRSMYHITQITHQHDIIRVVITIRMPTTHGRSRLQMLSKLSRPPQWS